ncbi:LysE family transporter [Bacillus solimangrovi]|uniref:Amino acid transporter n=1 Tax=Bacillus solimangrovi TaxID=1305675 RepID=A0A1E5LK29_9BACI|nr:LysE family transporter [Bacillus solimangrovi]OEH94453.1 amino acid transporter [Bacillus solimangrovi]
MGTYLSYIILGLSLSAPIGPINAAQLDKGIRFGFLHAWIVGIGAMVADILFMILIYFGITQFVDTPLVKIFLWLFGAFVLTYTGIESITQSNTLLNEKNEVTHETKIKAFRTGFLMAASNPLNILFWLGIYGSILAQTSTTLGTYQILIYSTGIFLGITLWDVTMAAIASGARNLFNTNILKIITIISGLFLIGFGLYFGLQAISLILN